MGSQKMVLCATSQVQALHRLQTAGAACCTPCLRKLCALHLPPCNPCAHRYKLRGRFPESRLGTAFAHPREFGPCTSTALGGRNESQGNNENGIGNRKAHGHAPVRSREDESEQHRSTAGRR